MQFKFLVFKIMNSFIKIILETLKESAETQNDDNKYKLYKVRPKSNDSDFYRAR